MMDEQEKDKSKPENRNQRFRRLAENRTNAILDKIRILEHLADKKRYDYSKEEVNDLFRAIDQQLKKAKDKFFENENSEKFKFSR
jgi:hypothetical protein